MMNAPKPGPYKPKPVVGEDPEVTELRARLNRPEPVKKPYVPTPHLTVRPFKDNPELKSLQKNLKK